MRRRLVIALLGVAAAAVPLAAIAQRKRVPVIGFLGGTSPDPNSALLAAFLGGLRERGYAVDENLAIEYRWALGRYEELPALAADLVAGRVDLIAIEGGPAAALAAKRATSTIPIVYVVDNPVAAGLAASLARPGGNLTGLALMNSELMPKRFQLLSELVPRVKVFAVLVNPNNPNAEPIVAATQAAARAKELQLHVLKAGGESEFDAAFAALTGVHAEALLVGDDPLFFSRRNRLVALALRHGAPAIYGRAEFAAAGGLIAYGASLSGVYHQLGIYAGRIIAGERPADLAVQQPTTFELVINLKTAKALGLTVPQSLLARADRVME